MLNGRLYRATLIPVALALGVAAFSFASRPAALVSTLAPDAFNGARASANLRQLAAEFPDRQPGSPGDWRLAERISQTLAGLGGTAGGGFAAHTRRYSARTIDGERSLATVIAQRPGSTDASPIVIMAHRDAPSSGRSRGLSARARAELELSGTAALLELARAFAASETRRTIVLASTSGGAGGDGGAADFAAHARGPFDAAIALGDVAGARVGRLFVVPYSDGFGSAPDQLQRTVADAIAQEAGAPAGAPSGIGQLAHLAFPLAVGEQGVLDAAGLPAVLVQTSGERGPSPGDAVSAERLAGFGRGVLSAVDALDAAPDLSAAMQTGMLIQRKTIPLWAVRLLVGALLLGPLILVADGLARLRRRRAPIARWTLWTLACALPFFAAALFARLLGLLGVGGAASVPVPPGAVPFDGSAAGAAVCVGLVLVLAWLAWPALIRRLGLSVSPDPNAAGLSMMLVLLGVCLVAWIVNPFTALLLLPALHLWLIVASPELRPGRLGALALVALALVPLALLVSFYAGQLGLGPTGVVRMAVGLVAGGHVGVLGAILWSLAVGCAAATTMLALRPPALPAGIDADEPARITIRGPMSYAGPGSLGGTESALRR